MDGSTRASNGTSTPPPPQPLTAAHTPLFTPPLLRHPSVVLDTPLDSPEDLAQLFSCEDGGEGVLVPWEVAWGDLETAGERATKQQERE